jgi:hypothetical protein
MRAWRLLPAALVALLAVQACSDSRTSGPLALALSPADGLAPSAVVGSVVAPSVVMVDDRERPQGGAQITFEVTSGGGALASANVMTDANGRATGQWTLGTVAGTNTVVARGGSGTPVTFHVTGVADAASSMQAVSTVSEVAAAGGRVGGTAAVRVTDRYGNAVAGVAVEFLASAGGSVVASLQQTGADGVATAGAWTVGPAEGEQLLTARAEGLPEVTFTTRAVAGSATALSLARLGGDQTTCPVNTSGCSFSVRVTTLTGAPVQGEGILWRGAGGATTTTVTNASGLSVAPNLGTPGTTGTFTQTAQLLSTADEISFSYTLVPQGGFSVELRFLTEVSPSVRAAFDYAKTRWEQVITGDLPAFSLTGANQVPANACGINHPAINEVVDDLLILVEIVPIDGPGKVLGSAGPCMLRGSTGLPMLGVMKLDSADLAMLDTNGSLRDVVLHEIGHVLGIGTLWNRLTLVQGAGTADPFYTGARALPGFLLGGGSFASGVPVENTGGAGTRDAHWRETTLRAELMTGWINSGANPLSTITVGSLMDLGYQVNFGAADTYALPLGSLQGQGPAAGAIELIELPLPAPRSAW